MDPLALLTGNEMKNCVSIKISTYHRPSRPIGSKMTRLSYILKALVTKYLTYLTAIFGILGQF